jgi:D-xylose transport system substrate-binding protein
MNAHPKLTKTFSMLLSTKLKPAATLLLSVILLISCNTSNTYKVTYLYPSPKLIRFEKEGKYLIDHLKSLGVDAEMVSADDNDTKQLELGMEALNNGANMLIITAINSNTIAPLVREANSRGVPVMAYNRLISNVEYDLFFTGNNKDNGRLFCEKALRDRPTGNYVILAGDRFDRNGVEQKLTIDSILKPHVDNGNIKIIYETYIENWSKVNAKFELEQIINDYGTNIDVIIAGADPLSEGAIDVLLKYGVNGKVFVTGQDAELTAVKNIYMGNQHMTIYHPHKKLGINAAELAFKILKGESAQKLANSATYNGQTKIPTFQAKSVAITKENIEKELIETGEYTWAQITN